MQLRQRTQSLEIRELREQVRCLQLALGRIEAAGAEGAAVSATECGYCGQPYPGPFHDTTACHDHWRERAERAEAEAARLRGALAVLADSAHHEECEVDREPERCVCVVAVAERLLAGKRTTSASTDKSTEDP